MEETKILDHGYVRLIESWGSDERIIEAARMSTQKGFDGWGPIDLGACFDCTAAGGPRNPGSRHGYEGSSDWCLGGRRQKSGDEKLLAFLWKNRHTTPFEMAGAIIEVQAPIFVFREWHRHRMQSYNELSARYTPLPDVNYTPTTDRMLGRAPGQIGHPHNKQAGTIKDAEVLTLDSSLEWLAELAEVYEHAERVYQSGLKRGVPKELARLPVPVARYSRMRAQAVLLNWFRFAGLRSDMNFGAQWEIRQYANAVLDLLEQLFPRSASLMREKPL